MPLDHDTAELTKNLLRDNDSSDLRSIREARLDPLLGGNADWLGQSSTVFESTFGDRLSSAEAGQLASLVSGGDPAGLARWFDDLVTAWENPEVSENGADAPRFTDRSEVDGQPGWWQGYDTTDDTWKYTRGTGQPSDESDWLDQDTAFAAMSEDDEPRFTDLSEVDGQPGWWQGYDTTDDTWKYTRGTGQPTDESDWLDQDTAFAAMSEDEEVVPAGTLDDAELKALADDVLSPALEQAISEVDGAEDLSAEDVYAALDLALAEVSAQ
jgi:hypothetical protein